MTKWTPVTDHSKYGVVIWNFNEEGTHKLKLIIGDTVYIFRKNGEWFYGCCSKNRSSWGIFPKSVIGLKESIIDKTGSHEAIIPREPPIIQEITSVLQEWGIIWKHLYVTGSTDFEVIRHMMNELIDWRKQIISGTLPVDELKELKYKVTSKIDIGNAILGLDMVVRDDHGNILNPDVTSSIDLYRAHEEATQRIKQISLMSGDVKNLKSSIHYSHSLYVTVKNFVCRIGEDADLLMTLYDASRGKFISENYLVKWGKEGLAKDLDQLNNLRVLFTDLGSKDLVREKVYLVCQIIRIGSMEFKENDYKRSTYIQKKSIEGLRRPFGVAAMEITDIINGKLDSDEEKQHFVPFVQCNERDFLDNVIKKVLSAKEISQKEHKGQGLWVCLKLLHGDLKQVKEENPHLISASTAVARKMGFPEIILPGDVRNDLYLTLVQGEFSKGSKSSDKNVEVTVRVCNEKGFIISDVISLGAGCDPMNEYRSVIYYHEDKPKWMETFKIAIPIEEFYNAHLKFSFKHRSSNEAKDKASQPFAMSFVKLMQNNGTTLNDEVHELVVYKIGNKRSEFGDIGYLSMPSTKADLDLHIGSIPVGPANSSSRHSMNSCQLAGLTLSTRDSFSISTQVCSTKLTQNVDLLGLLKWWSNPDNLKNNLTALMKVDGEEVVKFLQDTLDALFNILMQNSDSELYDNLVFEALIFIIGLISDRKYQHFRPVMDLYIKDNFSATLAYHKLMVVLKYYVENANQKEMQETLLRAMKSIEYIFKFIVRSRQLFAALNEGKGREQFELSLKQLLKSLTNMMVYKIPSTLLVQGACLKYLPFAIPDILSVFSCTELSNLLADLINNVPLNHLTKQKMMCVNDIVHSKLFTMAECRKILLPMITNQVCPLLEKQEEVELCIKIQSDIMVVLHSRDVGPTIDDISCLMLSMLRTIIQTVIKMDRDNSLVQNLVAVMISMLRQMTPYHYNQYISHFPTRTDLLDFLMEILLVFQDLVSKNVYLNDWNEMIMLQNSVILKALRYFSLTVREHFTHPFEYQLWNNFFHCSISFLTQEALQLENFSQNKRNKIISRYKDMRRETGFEIRSMWFNLGQCKGHFVPGMVGPFLEMTLIPEPELRKATIPIFFDMMLCEFYSSKPQSSIQYENCHNREIKGNFMEFENEMITQLDMLVEGGRGDEAYKDLIFEILSSHCENHLTMHDQGMKFVTTIVRLMRRLLEYRAIATDESKENRMSCTVNLLEFYHEINRKEMYIRYLYKLCDLHLECDNYVEAAFALKLHAKLLSWSDELLLQLLKNHKYPQCETHRELKERLYLDIIDYFDKGKLWEAGLPLCKELASQYENETFDYGQLSSLLKRISVFYDNIMKQVRPEPEYFRVAYYGRGFPSFLQNKVFIYRGKAYERLSDFSSRLLNQFPSAQLMTKLAPPGEDITESITQFLQINKVDPIMHEQNRFQGKTVHEQIIKYYKMNEVQKFTYSRPIRKGEKEANNEFANMWIERTTLVITHPLPGILHWFSSTTASTVEISPLENAIETMNSTNEKIYSLVMQHYSDPNLPINPLSMLLKGVVDAAVMGGIINYEKAFFNDNYLQRNSSKKDTDGIQKLKVLIASQIPLLEAGISVHKYKAPESLKPLHEHIENSFDNLKVHVEAKYGKMQPPPELQNRLPLALRKAKSFSSESKVQQEKSLDLSSLDSSDGNRKTVISVTSIPTTPSKMSTGGRAQSVWIKPSSPASNKIQTKKNRDSSALTLRRSSGPSSHSENQSQSQWYDILPSSNKSDVIELNEQLTPHRPLRSEAEKRNSRPTSGHFKDRATSSPTIQTSTTSSSQSLSAPSTPGFLSPSLSSLDISDDTPPPLPQKQAYADYTNISDDFQFNTLKKNSAPTRVKNKPPPPLPMKENIPQDAPKKQKSNSEIPPLLPKKPQRPTFETTDS